MVLAVSCQRGTAWPSSTSSRTDLRFSSFDFARPSWPSCRFRNHLGDPRDAVQYLHVQASKTLKHFSSFAMHLGAEHESTRTVLAGFTGTPVSLSDVHW